MHTEDLWVDWALEAIKVISWAVRCWGEQASRRQDPKLGAGEVAHFDIRVACCHLSWMHVAKGGGCWCEAGADSCGVSIVVMHFVLVQTTILGQ